jgi:hypothetical protein
LIDLFYKRSSKFIYTCLISSSPLVKFIARHSILYCRMFSIMGRNVLSCCERYRINVDDIINCTFPVENIDRFVKMSDEDAITASVLSELILCRDGTLHLSSDSFSQEDISLYIRHICTD